jgi:pyrroline-5-carboxylate reductase
MIEIGFIGLGNMGSSIFRAVAKSNKFTSIGIFDTDNYKTKLIEDEFKSSKVEIKIFTTLEDLVKNTNIVMICVKPQILSKLYSNIQSSNINDVLFISIAAGINTTTLTEELKSNRIVRFMPNLAAKCNKAVTAICKSASTKDEDKEVAFEIAKTFGSAFFLDEDKFSAFIGISGSAIAFVFEFAHAIALGGTHQGINYDTSLEIAFDTMESAKALYEVDKENPISLMSKVCSAGGTTIEGIKTLSDNKFTSAVMNSVIKTSERSKELEKK